MINIKGACNFMRVHSINLQTENKLINDYRNENSRIMDYFDYNPFSSGVFEQRLADLKNRNVNRSHLVEVLYRANTKWNAPSSTFDNIDRLKQDNSVVVIGGQQAGLLTGPMYTINKIISIVHLAKQQEEQLQVPVIPVFWIAGEDHDFDEINHIFMTDNTRMKKFTLLQRLLEKKAVSDIKIDQEAAGKWLVMLFEQLNETNHTKGLHETFEQLLENSDTYVDFFAQTIFHLFNDEGIVLLDSDSSHLRNFESDYFLNLINNQPQMTNGMKNSYDAIRNEGYSLSVEVDTNDGNLFFKQDNERVLLVRDENNNWIGKNNEVKFSESEMVNIARNRPDLLSNNVMTRPLMQEMVFPTLAFIAGPGELSYWSVLKQAFQVNDMKMPPVIPRLSFTFIERNIEKLLNKYHVMPDEAIKNGVMEVKAKWLAAKSDPPVNEVADQLKQTVKEAHQPLRELAKSIQSDLGDLSNKNLEYLIRDIEFLEKRINKTIEEKYAIEIHEFNILQLALNPSNSLQERVWNPLPLINRHGVDFIKQLSNQSCSYNKEHYLVYI
ncbi:bacillithiol biosynthesis cysteine-adding enzyme BshC [Virgibacillus flavescens]|uniref:bacillithiol biosynthesis cysteine-adding enzyme BshC n=1 Tax=Virgibacillus flavescens TaxID=1611422 RepID=UPI003D353253